MEEVGYMLGICLFFGTITSVYGGYLADKFNKLFFMYVLLVSMALLFFFLPTLSSITLILCALILVNTLSSSLGVTNNALLANLLPEENRTKAFSLRYSLENIGIAVGPFLGAWTMHWHVQGPFFLAGFFTLAMLLLLIIFRQHFNKTLSSSRTVEKPSEPSHFIEVLHVLRRDKRLIFFTLGGICSMTVYGPLLTYLSQYLVISQSADMAYQTIAYVSAVNAALVIGLQYLVGCRLKKEHLMYWLIISIIAFAVGLTILSLSAPLLPWLFAIALFTLGEVIIVTIEYMFIDAIAPLHAKGSYFGAQNLIFLGVALGPVLCGFLLKNSSPHSMFYALIAIVLFSFIFYYLGYRHEKRVN